MTGVVFNFARQNTPMGGSSSTQTAKDTSTVMSNVVSNTTGNCIVSGTGSNTIILAGTGNTIDNLQQSTTITIDPANSVGGTCQLSSDFNSSLGASINSQQSSAANTSTNNTSQFLDWNATNQSDYVSNAMIGSYTINNTLNCLSTLSGSNIVVEAGSGNVIQDVTQQVNEKIATSCVETDPITINTAFNVTMATNQSNTYSASVLGNLSDVFSSIFTKTVLIAVIGFILLIALIVLVKAHSGAYAPDNGASYPAASYPAASYPAAGYPAAQ